MFYVQMFIRLKATEVIITPSTYNDRAVYDKLYNHFLLLFFYIEKRDKNNNKFVFTLKNLFSAMCRYIKNTNKNACFSIKKKVMTTSRMVLRCQWSRWYWGWQQQKKWLHDMTTLKFCILISHTLMHIYYPWTTRNKHKSNIDYNSFIFLREHYTEIQTMHFLHTFFFW